MKLKEIKKLTKKQLIKELKLIDKKIANLGIRRYASWDLNTEENKLIDKRFFLNTELKKRKKELTSLLICVIIIL